MTAAKAHIIEEERKTMVLELQYTEIRDTTSYYSLMKNVFFDPSTPDVAFEKRDNKLLVMVPYEQSSLRYYNKNELLTLCELETIGVSRYNQKFKIDDLEPEYCALYADYFTQGGVFYHSPQKFKIWHMNMHKHFYETYTIIQ